MGMTVLRMSGMPMAVLVTPYPIPMAEIVVKGFCFWMWRSSSSLKVEVPSSTVSIAGWNDMMPGLTTLDYELRGDASGCNSSSLRIDMD